MTPRRRSAGIPRVFTFTVTGEDQFPIDMLRYDLCYPKRETDSAAVIRSFNPRMARTHGPHHVTLVSSKRPTEERWGSFGWALESVE